MQPVGENVITCGKLQRGLGGASKLSSMMTINAEQNTATRLASILSRSCLWRPTARYNSLVHALMHRSHRQLAHFFNDTFVSRSSCDEKAQVCLLRRG